MRCASTGQVEIMMEGGMTMAGRKPKPTAIKKLEGNPGKRKLNTKEPIPAITFISSLIATTMEMRMYIS